MSREVQRRHTYGHRELVLRDAEALDEVLHENLTRVVDRLDPVSGSQRSPPPPLRRQCATLQIAQAMTITAATSAAQSMGPEASSPTLTDLG